MLRDTTPAPLNHETQELNNPQDEAGVISHKNNITFTSVRGLNFISGGRSWSEINWGFCFISEIRAERGLRKRC